MSECNTYIWLPFAIVLFELFLLSLIVLSMVVPATYTVFMEKSYA